MYRWSLLVMTCVACGRIGFDTVVDGEVGAPPGDGSMMTMGCTTLRQSNSNGNGQVQGPTTWDTSAHLEPTLAGSTIICSDWHKTTVANDPIVAFTDNLGDTYTNAMTIVQDAMNSFDLWYLTNAPADVRFWIVQLQTTDAGYYNDQQCWEYTGLSTGAPDGVAGGSATSNASAQLDLPAISTTHAGDLIFAAFNQAGAKITAAGSGYTLTAMTDGSKFESKIGGAAGMESVTAKTAAANQVVASYWELALACGP